MYWILRRGPKVMTAGGVGRKIVAKSTFDRGPAPSIPPSCFNPATNRCSFEIADASNVVAEIDENNNLNGGACGAQFQ